MSDGEVSTIVSKVVESRGRVRRMYSQSIILETKDGLRMEIGVCYGPGELLPWAVKRAMFPKACVFAEMERGFMNFRSAETRTYERRYYDAEKTKWVYCEV